MLGSSNLIIFSLLSPFSCTSSYSDCIAINNFRLHFIFITVCLSLALSKHLLSWLRALPKFVDSRVISFVFVTLVAKDEKDDIVTQTSEPMHDGHFDHKCK